jgi:hypothetical protein
MAFDAQSHYPITISGPLESYFPSRSEIYECHFKKSATGTRSIETGSLVYFKSAYLAGGTVMYNLYCINTNEYFDCVLNMGYNHQIKSDDINTLIYAAKLAHDNFKLFFKLFS